MNFVKEEEKCKRKENRSELAFVERLQATRLVSLFFLAFAF